MDDSFTDGTGTIGGTAGDPAPWVVDAGPPSGPNGAAGASVVLGTVTCALAVTAVAVEALWILAAASATGLAAIVTGAIGLRRTYRGEGGHRGAAVGGVVLGMVVGGGATVLMLGIGAFVWFYGQILDTQDERGTDPDRGGHDAPLSPGDPTGH